MKKLYTGEALKKQKVEPRQVLREETKKRAFANVLFIERKKPLDLSMLKLKKTMH